MLCTKKHTKHILKYHLVIAKRPFTVKKINCVHQTRPRKGAQHPTLCYSCSLYWLLCQKWDWFLSSTGAKVNGQYCWDIVLSQQMLDAIIVSFITVLSFSKTVHRYILHSTQSNCCSAKLSTSFLLSYGPITPLTVRFRESHSSTSMSCK